MYKDFALFMLTLPFRESLMDHLWFIPPLLLGVVVGYYIITYGKEKIGLILTFLFMLLTLLIASINQNNEVFTSEKK